MSNEWNDPPGVNPNGSVASSDDSTRDRAPERRRLRGPFAGLRRLIWWVFWLGLIAAAVVGATAYARPTSPLSGAIQLMLGYVVTIGATLATGWGALWLVDKALVFLKR
ncbi:hypothetical protein [Halococcus sp. PRR34]|uniref:hypothetical protein n=1 Tax=Halococcus sp. PRR34 TaxID=3020830 RepID=UPI00235FD757|nr:hypothetical protein [Halococcus sp. PRR34]